MSTQHTKIHFALVPFTGLGLYGGFRGDTWLKNRIKVFKQFVLPAMVNQSKLEYLVWIAWREEEQSNPIVQDFMRSLDGIRGMRFVHTFGGCPFYDDKYEDSVAKQRLLNTLKKSLPFLQEYVGDADVVYLTIWPSDDLYFSHAIHNLQNYEYKEKRSIGYTKGYIMRYDTFEVAEYNPTTIPPFFTIMFPAKVFLDPELHYEYIGPYESHEYIKDVTEFIPLEGRGFIVGIHGENISTVFDHPFKGRVLSEREAENIRITSGIYFAQPIQLKKDLFRRVSKKLINLLPRPIQFFIIQKVSPGVREAIRKYYYHNI